jgi:hypothetical protein
VLSAIAMILVPLPRSVLPTPRPPLFCGSEVPVDESFMEVESAAGVPVFREGF